MLIALMPLLGAARAMYWQSLPHWGLTPWLAFAPLIAMVMAVFLVRYLEGRMWLRARNANFCICPSCLYPLEEIDGICPECGSAFTRTTLRDSWLRVPGLDRHYLR
jgi:hypothetical protein